MPFTKQPDGSVRDDQTGVVLHLGMAAYVLAHTVQQHALLGETYYTPSDSFVPCGGGLILTYNKGENAVRADRGGETLLALWRQLASATARAEAAEGQARALGAQVATLQAELNAQQRTPVDPNDPAALAAVRALAAALASLPPVAPAASEPAA